MFNSVEFVLMFLSMFSSVTKESVTCTWALLYLAFDYNKEERKVRPVDWFKRQMALKSIEPLTALAASCGYDIKKIKKEKMSDMVAYELLCAIVVPILEKLSPEELEEISKTDSGGSELLVLPLEDIKALVKMWTQHVREDEEKYERFGGLPALGSVEYTSGGPTDRSNASATSDFGPERVLDKAVKHGLDEAPRNEKLGPWSRMKMDGKTAAFILAYCNEDAAVTTKTNLRRNGRVVKRQMIASKTPRGTAMEDSNMWEMVHEAETGDENLNSYPSFLTASSGLAVASLFGRPRVFHTNSHDGILAGERSNEDTRNWSDDEMECEWSMQIDGRQDEELSQDWPEPMVPQHTQNESTSGPPVLNARYNLPSRLDIPKVPRASLPVNVDDIFGVGFQGVNQTPEHAPVSTYDGIDMEIPKTPLKHNRSDFAYEAWGQQSIGGITEFDDQGGRLDVPSVITNGHDSEEIPMPRTPPMNNGGEFDYGPWAGYSAGSLSRASGPAGPSGHSAMVTETSELDSNVIAGPLMSSHAMNNYDSGDIMMPRTPMKHDHGEFEHGLWSKYSVGSLNEASFQGASTSTPPVVIPNLTRANMPSRRFDIFDPDYQCPRPPHEPGVTNSFNSGNVGMPETALENNPNGFVYGLWGERTMGTFEASGRAGPLTRPGTTMATSVLHSNAIAGSSMPQGTMSNYDNRDVEMPRTPLKHDRGEFDYGLWSEASAGVTDETRLISMDHHEPIGAQTPRTPINRNRGTVFDYEMWARRLGLVSSVDETNHQERAASPGPVMDMPRLRSNVPARASIRSLHVLRRRIGARNLRAAAAAHKEMGEDGGMGPTTSMLNNVLVAQREGGISRDSMGHTEIARRWIALPPLVGYYERSRKYRERNGESDTSRTGSDSASLLTPGATPFLTPGTTSLLTPRTSACPTMTEEYYSEIAVKWEALQKERWQIGLQEAYEGYTGDMAAELGRSMVAKAVEVVGRTFRGLWKN